MFFLYMILLLLFFFFFFNDTATTEIYTLSLHDALPICSAKRWLPNWLETCWAEIASTVDWISLCRSEEHTSELQSQSNLVCRLLLEKKKKHNKPDHISHTYHVARRTSITVH